ncbi:cytochrome P450 [Hymenopellis radicata]|nr:cytochrome P450 [Hymenopellis radicata]
MHSHLSPSAIGAALVIALVLLFERFWRRRSPVSLVPGPPSPSWLLGHERVLSAQDQAGDLEFPWFREYGATFRVKGCLSEEKLMTADAKAIQHILHASGYRYPKPGDSRHALTELLGNGVAGAEGATHQRQRKVLNPAFSATQLRTFSSIFQSLSKKFTVRLQGASREGGQIVNIHLWLSRVTLDALGETAFGYKFGALDEETNELANQLKHLFAESIRRPIKDIIHRFMWRRLPWWFMDLVYVPGKQALRFLRFQDLSKQIARQVLDTNQAQESLDRDDPKSMQRKDILTILVRANMEQDEKRRLSEDEVLSQMSTMILGGHETSASALAWTLYELSRYPEHQDRIRREISEIRHRYGDGYELSPQDYDTMSFMNAVIKEGLRFHPVANVISREAQQDDTIPLSEPVVTKTGVKMTELFIKKGQPIQISIPYYNRNPAVWGNDADRWNPERFLQTVTHTGDKIPVGVYANLLSFSAGVRGCIGWRFAVIEMQIILTELVENFKFALPDDGTQIRRAGGTMMPLVRGKEADGVQMPLHITPL